MACFRIHTCVDPQALLRVLGLFAQRAITPTAVDMQVGEDRMRIHVTVPDLGDARAAILAAKLRETFVVTHVELDQWLATV